MKKQATIHLTVAHPTSASNAKLAALTNAVLATITGGGAPLPPDNDPPPETADPSKSG
jgi:hypothetical protein